MSTHISLFSVDIQDRDMLYRMIDTDYPSWQQYLISAQNPRHIIALIDQIEKIR